MTGLRYPATQDVLQPLEALIRGTEEAAASISSFAASNLFAARFVNRARLGLLNRRFADIPGRNHSDESRHGPEDQQRRAFECGGVRLFRLLALRELSDELTSSAPTVMCLIDSHQ